MCGIAGALGLGTPLRDADRAVVEAMTGLLRHRGPDAQGVLADERAALGNTRLSVLDPSAGGSLPMADDKDGLWLCYNGMVTNFASLRGELAARQRFRSTGDSEVLLRLYAERGIGLIHRLNGMFAFCLYDRRARKAHLVRDPFGLRPLFYAQARGRLWFASELKALLEAPGVGRELDREALWHYLSLGYIPGNRTPFRAVRELLEGRRLEVDLSTGLVEEKRWHRLAYGLGPDRTEEGAVERLRELLLGALGRNLASDVPVGLTLSGGIDTSGLLGLARHLGASRELHTFSIVMDEPSFDESRYQRAMVDFARPVHHEVRVRAEDVLENLETAVAHLDEPLVNGACVPMLLLAREARRHVGVLLSGEGGDEVFNAYETYRAFKARALYRGLVPSLVRAAARRLAGSLPCSYRKLSFDFLCKRFTSGAELDVPRAHLFWRHVLDDAGKERLFRRAPGEDWPDTASLFSDLYEELAGDEPLDRLSQIDLRYYLVDDLMVKNDRMLSAHGLESRFPYLDREVVEFAAGLPPAARLPGFRGRHLQKRALEPFLPPAVLRRSNMGLELPHSLWFLDSLRPLVERTLTRDSIEALGFLEPEAVETLWKEHLDRRRDNGRPLWAVLNLVLWHRLFVERGDYKRRLAQAPPASPRPATASPGATTPSGACCRR